MKDTLNQLNTDWPLPKFQFLVEWDSEQMFFQEVAGLDKEVQTIEAHKGNTSQFSTIKMPGIKKFENITLKKGVVKSSDHFWEWFNAIKMNSIKRKSMTITLLDESGKATIKWTLSNAWPTKISNIETSADSDVLVERVEIVCEDITVVNS